MCRACDALDFEEEKHALLAKAHLALAAKYRLKAVEETRQELKEAAQECRCAKEDLADCMRDASSEVLADRATMLVILSAHGEFLEECSPGIRSDPELVLTACKESGWALVFATPEMQADRDFVTQAIRLDGHALSGASEDLKEDRELVLMATQGNPIALLRASDDLWYDRELKLTALQLFTRRLALTEEVYYLGEFFETEEELADKELLLEAARVDASILGFASPELKRDKEFVLEVMRKAPQEDQEICYCEADDSVQASVSLEDFQGACNSVLASAGEDAPVLTITAWPPAAGPAPDANLQHPSPSCCEVCLLSGASFTCLLTDSEAGSGGAAGAAEEAERGSKRRRTSPPLTVGQLADRVKAAFLVQVQADRPPARIFIVFNKHSAEGEGEGLSVPVTPWDWKRPVSDFW